MSSREFFGTVFFMFMGFAVAENSKVDYKGYGDEFAMWFAALMMFLVSVLRFPCIGAAEERKSYRPVWAFSFMRFIFSASLIIDMSAVGMVGLSYLMSIVTFVEFVQCYYLSVVTD